jgi:hypothetical protein
MSTTLHRLLPVFALFSAAPALACGEPHLSTSQYVVLAVSLFSAPILGVLLVDRGAFALAARVRGLRRLHRPSLLGPVLAVFAVLAAITGFTTSNVEVAFLGAVTVPFAAMVSALSFARSVLIEQRGQRSAQALRVAGVVGVSALLLLTFILH